MVERGSVSRRLQIPAQSGMAGFNTISAWTAVAIRHCLWGAVAEEACCLYSGALSLGDTPQPILGQVGRCCRHTNKADNTGTAAVIYVCVCVKGAHMGGVGAVNGRRKCEGQENRTCFLCRRWGSFSFKHVCVCLVYILFFKLTQEMFEGVEDKGRGV